MLLQPISAGDFELARRQAASSALGGVSRVRAADTERQATLQEDQLVGHLGSIALHRYLHGNVTSYVYARHLQNRFPRIGDSGEDVLGANVDVKTSLMRRSQDPTTYNLCVRPRERHPEWVYVLALLPQNYESLRWLYLAGWLSDEELPAEPRAEGPLKGTYAVSATALHPLPPIRYRFQ